MTSTRKKQVRTLAILLVAVVALTIGFAAFTSSLRIKTRLSVNPNKGTFNVKFSKEASSLVEDNVIPQKSSDIFEAFPGIIDNSGIPTISDLGGEFTQPGESITYEFYALNTGEYKAYLTDVIFGNVDGESTNKVCTSLDGTHQSEVDSACSNINIKVTVGSDILTTSRSNLVGHNLEPSQSEKVKVEITYSSGGILPEVPFEVIFGDISMVYNSLEATDSDTTPVVENVVDVDFPPTCYLAISDGDGGASIVFYNSAAEDCPQNQSAAEPVIPSSLPIYNVVLTYNNDKCISNVQYLMDEGIIDDVESVEEVCTGSFGSSGSTITVTNDFPLSAFFYFVAPAADIEYTRVDDNTYPVTQIALMSFRYVGDDDVEDLVALGLPYNPKLTGVTLPNSLKLIADSAFEYNQLTTLTIPSSVESIGDDAFKHNQLTSVDLTNATSLTTIDRYAFYKNNLTSITIPNSVTYIGENAFNYNNLTSVEIGTGISSIGDFAFGNATETEDGITYGPNALTSVTIHVPSSNTSDFTNNSQFGWASGYSDSNIVWSDN